VCRNKVRIEPSRPFGDAPCPACGSLLWFLATGDDACFFERDQDESIERRLRALIAERLGINPDSVRDGDWRELGIDSLDLVELALDLEEEA
jgi:acyl carrier protein